MGGWVGIRVMCIWVCGWAYMCVGGVGVGGPGMEG